MGVGSVQTLGNQLVVTKSDTSRTIFNPTGSNIYYAVNNTVNLDHIKIIGHDTLNIFYKNGASQLAYYTGNNIWYADPSFSAGDPPKWMWPLDFHAGIHISQSFNGIPIPSTVPNGHTGLDITYSGIIGANIYAITDSTVNNLGFTSSNGNAIKLEAWDGSFYEFYHMIAPTPLSIGDVIPIGTVVGNADTTGTNATGPHCHMGTSETGWPGLNATFADMVDPLIYMSDRGAPYPW